MPIALMGYCVGELLVVLPGGVIHIPVYFSIVIPNVRVNTIAEVGVGSYLRPQQIRKAKAQGIHLSFAAVQDRQLQGVVLIGNASSDKLDLCPIHIAQTHIADSAHIGGIGILLSDNFPEFLFVKSHCLHLRFR